MCDNTQHSYKFTTFSLFNQYEIVYFNNFRNWLNRKQDAQPCNLKLGRIFSKEIFPFFLPLRIFILRTWSSAPLLLASQFPTTAEELKSLGSTSRYEYRAIKRFLQSISSSMIVHFERIIPISWLKLHTIGLYNSCPFKPWTGAHRPSPRHPKVDPPPPEGASSVREREHDREPGHHSSGNPKKYRVWIRTPKCIMFAGFLRSRRCVTKNGFTATKLRPCQCQLQQLNVPTTRLICFYAGISVSSELWEPSEQSSLTIWYGVGRSVVLPLCVAQRFSS